MSWSAKKRKSGAWCFRAPGRTAQINSIPKAAEHYITTHDPELGAVPAAITSAKKDERAGNAQSLVDAIEALEVSVAVHGRPVPNDAAIATHGSASSAPSLNAPESANKRDRQRPRRSTADNL